MNLCKCTELEIQRQQVLDELSSVQLIVQMLKREHVEEDSATKPTQQMEAELEVDNSWSETIPQGLKRRTEGSLKLINSKEQIVTSNRYEALVIESIMSGNEIGMKSRCENKPKLKITVKKKI
jgi:hypothetical protein